MISGWIEVDSFAQIRLILEAKFDDDSLCPDQSLFFDPLANWEKIF